MDVVSAGVGEVQSKKQLEAWADGWRKRVRSDSFDPRQHPVGGKSGEFRADKCESNCEKVPMRKSMWELPSICKHLCVRL